MLLLLSLAVTAAMTATVARIAAKVDAAGRRMLLRAVAAITILTVAGVIWEIAAWKSFSGNADSFRGIIASPGADTSSYIYTVRGHHYEHWGFKVPMLSTATLVLLTSITSIILSTHRRRSALIAFGIGVTTVLLLGLFVLFSGYYYLIATNFFI